MHIVILKPWIRLISGIAQVPHDTFHQHRGCFLHMVLEPWQEFAIHHPGFMHQEADTSVEKRARVLAGVESDLRKINYQSIIFAKSLLSLNLGFLISIVGTKVYFIQLWKKSHWSLMYNVQYRFFNSTKSTLFCQCSQPFRWFQASGFGAVIKIIAVKVQRPPNWTVFTKSVHKTHVPNSSFIYSSHKNNF